MIERSCHMITLIRGDRFRSVVTGKVFELKIVGDRMVVLESEDQANQVLTARDNLRFFYKRIGSKIEPGPAR